MTKQLKDEFIGIRITARQREILERHAQANKLSLSEVIRMSVELLADTLEESQTRSTKTESKTESKPARAKHIIRPKIVKREASPQVWYEDETRQQRAERIAKHVTDVIGKLPKTAQY